jgi:hypothetical protein
VGVVGGFGGTGVVVEGLGWTTTLNYHVAIYGREWAGAVVGAGSGRLEVEKKVGVVYIWL